MTEAMPFLQKTILLSYDPRSFGPEVFFTIISLFITTPYLHRYEQKSFYTKQISVYSASSSNVYGVT